MLEVKKHGRAKETFRFYGVSDTFIDTLVISIFVIYVYRETLSVQKPNNTPTNLQPTLLHGQVTKWIYVGNII